MDELIKISKVILGDGKVNAVNSREVYDFLGVKTHYSTWMKRCIDKYDFEEGEDFISNLKESTGGRPEKEFIVTLDMAKELCMVSDTKKGKETRKYFITAEKRLNKSMTVTELIEYNTKVIEHLKDRTVRLETTIKTQEPLVLFAETVSTAENGTTIRNWVGMMKQEQGLKVGEKKVIKYLIDKRYLYRDKAKKLTPYADRFDLFSLEPLVISTKDGNKETKSLKITGSGQVKLTEKIVKKFGVYDEQ